MKTPISCLLLLLLLWSQPCHSLRYQTSDSLRVVRLLDEAARQPADANLILFFAHQLEGTPYEAATLEGDGEEQLVVNLRAFDCTTFVETVMALVLTARSGSLLWDDFVYHLTLLRYREGRISGYASRNHYFSQWVENGAGLGLMSELSESPLFRSRPLRLSFMSRHPNSYSALKGQPEAQRQIREREQAVLADSVFFLPKASLLQGREALSFIRDGDVLALVSDVDGLDVSHMGLAEWGSDGRLHLLHASSRAGRVMHDSVPLADYMKGQSRQAGVRVVRMRTTGEATTVKAE